MLRSITTCALKKKPTTLIFVLSFFLSVPTANTATRTVLFMSENEKPVKERGVSFDQDGKSNVWAIEPKVEISTKSGEEKTKTALIAGGGLVAAAVAAAAILSNLPDPNQF